MQAGFAVNPAGRPSSSRHGSQPRPRHQPGGSRPSSPVHPRGPAQQPAGKPGDGRKRVVANSGLEGFLGLSAFLKPEVAAMFSAVLAVGSVGLNYWGNLLTESKRVELQKEIDREKQAEAILSELASIISRYRGPLLESSVDLEQRLWHLATMTGEWYKGEAVLCGEEIAYSLFTLSQFLGFLEVVRREGPRERSFLAAGNPQGSDTLATLMEAFRFVLCASPATLQGWLDEPDAERDHPGARQRRPYVPVKGKRKKMVAGLDGPEALAIPLRVSRGSQRAIGSQMGATPLGAERHYTLSYSQFLAKLQSDADFAAWLAPIETDLAALLTGASWMGEPSGPCHRWTRILLLQQLLIDTIDLLDPDYVRIPANRRIRLAPVAYAPLPNVEQYQAALTLLSGPDTSRLSVGFGGRRAPAALQPDSGEHFAALQNLMHPERVLAAASQRRATMSAGPASKAGSGAASPGGSPGASVSDEDAPGGASSGGGGGAGPILPVMDLPSVGATGARLLKQLTGQDGAGRGDEAVQPQLQPSSIVPPTSQSAPPSGDLGGTPVTADRRALAPPAALRNGRRK